MTDETTTQQVEDTADKIREGLKAGTDTTDAVEDTSGVETTQKPEDKKPTLSDAEAKLLKETMKHKAAAKKAADDLKALQDKISGIDVDKYQALIAKEEEQETQALEKKGEYDRLLLKQKDAADAKVKAEKDRADAAEADKAKLLKQIEDLTTGTAFANSKFVSEKLTLTPNKAKALYNSHFEYVDGAMVGYDKPKGETDRTMIVDASGEAVSFEAAIEAIINADPDKDYLLKADVKPGAGSKPVQQEKPKNQREYVDTTDKIAAGLEALIKSQAKK